MLVSAAPAEPGGQSPEVQPRSSRSAVHSLALVGRDGSQLQSAKRYQFTLKEQHPGGLGLTLGAAAHTNCCGCAQSEGAATATLGSHVQPTPSPAGQRPLIGATPDAQA